MRKPNNTLTRLDKALYEAELARVQAELVKLQEWVTSQGLRVCVVFEGRDAAGKGGAIRRIVERTNPRVVKVVALGTPTERQRSQWYYQRYVPHLPASGEIVLFDRSWYNRAGVEHVMGFCTTEEYQEFLRSCPLFEEMLIKSGIILIKFWFSVSDEEQAKRFTDRVEHPEKRWKLSDMDLQSRARWVDYSDAKDVMFAHTDTTASPWWVVDADDKRRARLNCIRHLLETINYEEPSSPKAKIPPIQTKKNHRRPDIDAQTLVTNHYPNGAK
jgi:polyphosphate kinase 2